MRHFAPAATAALATLVFFSCAKPDPHESGIKQLVAASFVCPADTDRIAWIEDRYGEQNLQGGTTSHRTDVVEALSLIPTEYLYWVFDHNEVPVELRQTGGSTRGATTSVGRAGVWRPERIWVGQMTGNFNPMNHEFGHATKHYLAATFPDFAADLTATYRRAMAAEEAQLMRGYARSSESEYFAELFDSYYCGTESRDDIEDNMPITYAFMQTYLIDPDALEGTSGDATLAGAREGVDDDNDRVSNAYDQCPETAVGEAIAFGTQTYGCAENQLN